MEGLAVCAAFVVLFAITWLMFWLSIDPGDANDFMPPVDDDD